MKFREWSKEERQASMARAANLFLNIVACPDCGLPWAEGLVHFDCPGPAPEPELAEVSRTVPHSFYSHWPRASRTKCDFCGLVLADHPADVADEDDVAKHPVTALRRHRQAAAR